MSIKNGNGRFTPGRQFNYWGAQAFVAMEDVKAGNIVTGCGLRGDHMVAQLADANDPLLAQGPLHVAKHDTPGVGTRVESTNHGVILEWLILSKGVDTSGKIVHDLVYLGTEGRHSFVPVGEKPRVIGKVLTVGPASKLEGGEPGCGSILLKP
jgi:hypothetical protein